MKPEKSMGRFAVCIRNAGHPASLELRKIYRILPDARAAERGLVRVRDESGEDYLYPNDYFMAIELSPSLEEAIASLPAG